MIQRWRLISFIHHRVDASSIRQLVPSELEIDEFDGTAWVGLVPFRMTSRIAGISEIPWFSTFPETNVRTYVRGPDGGRGIWFFSLDVARSAMAGAGAAFGLPYRWSRMAIEGPFRDVTYTCRRLVPTLVRSRAAVVAQPLPIAMTAREHFLTARFQQYGTGPIGLFAIDVEHEPWTLHAARAPILQDELVEAAGIRSASGAPLVHQSAGVSDVRVGVPRRLT